MFGSLASNCSPGCLDIVSNSIEYAKWKKLPNLLNIDSSELKNIEKEECTHAMMKFFHHVNNKVLWKDFQYFLEIKPERLDIHEKLSHIFSGNFKSTFYFALFPTIR